MDKPTHYIVDGEVLQAIASYLSSKPYSEVYDLFAALRGAKPYVSPPTHPNDEGVENVSAD